jgi:hypothetical protein
MEAPARVEGDGAGPSSRHRRALSLIAISVVVMVGSGLAYLHATSISGPKSAGLATSSAPSSTSLAVDTGPAPIPLTEVFRSPSMQYTIKFPTGWTATPAAEAGRGDRDSSGRLSVDMLDGGSVVFTGTSAPLAGGQSPANWIGWYLATAGTNQCGVREYTDFMGLTGLIDLNGCSSTDLPGHIYSAAVVIDGRGYSFNIQGKVDHRLFVSMLRTVSFGS